MPDYNRIQMFRFIAQLLHPTAVLDASYFPAPQIFWDHLVKLGSSQLVLPAIYGALKRKKLEHHVPQDLISYLQEISELNKKRNTDILKQIDFLSELFNGHLIEHVFLKGSALLITRPYDALSERMVGDIDILVSEKDLSRSQKLLLDQGFEAVSNEFSFVRGVFSDNYNKHLKRIAHPNYIAAVEIHRRLLIKENHLIPPKDVLKNKLQSKQSYWIPSEQHLWKHAILNWQFNDGGMIRNFLTFKSVVDVLYLESKDDVLELKNESNAVKHFYSLLSFYYGNYKNYYHLKKMIYKWKLESIVFEKLSSFLKNLSSFFSLCFSRINFFLSSKIYRKRVINNRKLFVKRILDFWNK